ncbi:MAG: radical SAM protein [Desulfobacterales bacterium]|nr:B12-binding domain-containing radical SAM protein [Deltaproteobacteria bacterium]
MKKLLLINPVGRRSGLLLSRFSTFSPLGLAYVAAVTPPNWEVRIADENFDTFQFEEADLVGITAFTSNITRAYEIARQYRKRKIKVVIGGIHASMMPDEAQQFADSVVVGEVEDIWHKLLADFESNCLKPLYIGPRIEYGRSKILPRRDLLHPNYFWHSIQTSRGCPFNCHFCSVSRYLGNKFRQRSAQNVLAELADIKGQFLAFLDDNLIGYSPESKARTLELFNGMIKGGLNQKWWMQTSINAADDEHIIEAAAQAGCIFAFIGFETISKASLRDMKKGINIKIGVQNYQKVVDVFHKYGIAVYGAFIIGNDHESPAYYKQLARFLVRSGIDIIQITLLTPLPGTELMQHLLKEGRIIHSDYPQDWDKYRFSYMVHQPQDVQPHTIYIGNNYIKKNIYSFPNYPFRLVRSLFSLKNKTNFYATYKFNKALKKGWKNSHYYKEYPSDLDANPY